jgi:hypothetical protein
VTRSTRHVAIAAFATGTALLASGCGASNGSHVAQLGPTSTATRAPSTGSSGSTEEQALGYARCLQGHGVPNWPDPASSGVFDKTKLTLQQLGVSGSRLEAA